MGNRCRPGTFPAQTWEETGRSPGEALGHGRLTGLRTGPSILFTLTAEPV